MNKYFEVGINVVEDNLRTIKSKLLQNTSKENAQYILDNIKLDSDFYIALNKEYEEGNNFKDLAKKENLEESLIDIFDFTPYAHQENSIKSIKNSHDTVISTGTGSGKTESFIIPIIDYCLKNSHKKGVKAIIIYPMNALANDQKRRINEILSKTDLTFGIFTGETPRKSADTKIDKTELVDTKLDDQNKEEIYHNQIYYREDLVEELPDILITNYVMLDRILTSEKNSALINNSRETLKYVVLDEIHTYRGNKGAHLKFLLDRLRYSVNNKLVHIGCSATLAKGNRSKSSEGYLYGNSLDQFIVPLFDNKEYELIQAEYKAPAEIPQDIENYQELKLIRDEIYSGSKSISDLIELLKLHNFDYNKQKLNELLNKNSDILSFKVYLFMSDAQGGIKRCINCGKYHLGSSSSCLSCGSPLFYVNPNNPKMMIGRIDRNKKLTNDILKSMLAKNEVTFVGIVDKDYQINEDDLVLRLNKPFNYDKNNCIEINNSPDGDVKLIYLEEVPDLFWFDKNQSFFDISRDILRNMPEDNRKILSFKDSRQEVSKNKNLANDIFVSNTFMEISKYITSNKELSLKDAHDNIKEKIELFSKENESHKIFEKSLTDFDIWFERLLQYKKENIKITYKNEDYLSENEKLIMDFFLQERLIDFKPIVKPNTKYLSYSLYSLKRVSVAVLEEETTLSEEFAKISLSKRGVNFKKFLDQRNVSYENLNILEIIKSLISRGYLKVYKDKKDKEIQMYCIERDVLNIVFEKSNYNTLKEVIYDNFFISETHSSEVNKEEKSEIENEFQNNKLNILFSTPTLEMGIDIGGLNVVFMQGFPPLPSNFAQRAGRAGRKNDKTALIVTLCNDENYHDMYYFQNPKDMIDGVINPPKFQIDNFAIGKKHLNALVYQLSKFNDKEMLINEGIKAFGSLSKKEIDQYIRSTDFCKLLGKSSYILYEKNIFPDYSFRRDEVKVYEISALGKSKKEKENYEISSREPELACKEYRPGDIKYMSGGIYRLEDNDDCYKVVDTLLGEARQYKEIYAKEAKGHIAIGDFTSSAPSRELIKYINENDAIRRTKENIINFEYYKDIELQFIDLGDSKKDNDKYYSGSTAQILRRQVILVYYNRDILTYENIMSFIALINNSIKELYGLDDSEIKIMYDETKEVFALYDANGNQNIDLKKIFLDIDNVISYGYNKVKNCDCEEINGCYICMKSYSLNKYAAVLNKIKAYKIAGYWIGKNRLPVDIRITEDYGDIYDIDISVNVKTGKEIELVYENNKEIEQIGEQSQNEAIFKGLIKVLNKLDEDIEYVKISSKAKYIVDAINGEAKVKNANLAFSKFNFIRLKYKNVYGEKV